ncbi:MAG: hypothetical protein QG600_576, partial [Patescibacteria group bacterium]|nr:hypothetical protein [Patescibacteria group bacterium]
QQRDSGGTHQSPRADVTSGGEANLRLPLFPNQTPTSRTDFTNNNSYRIVF